MTPVNLINLTIDSPTDRYDHRLGMKVTVDPNGILNMKKFYEDIKKDDGPKVKSLQNELDNLNLKYRNLKQDFDLLNKNSKEYKNSFGGDNKKINLMDEYSRSKELAELKDENKDLQKKMEIMVDKLKKLSEENKENDGDIEKLKRELKVYKSSNPGMRNFFEELKPINLDDINLIGNNNMNV